LVFTINFNHILEPAGRYDLATALKEHRNRSAGMQPIYRYPDFSNSSDFFGGQSSSSQSFMFLLNGLAKSFVSYIDDPDEEINQMMELASKVSLQPKIQIFVFLRTSSKQRRTSKMEQRQRPNIP
jgi:hypothetical protein